MIPIKGYEKRYAITEEGRVFSFVSARFISLHALNSKGYPKVMLSNGNQKRKYFSIHRLVAQAYIPNLFNKPQINHKNGIKTDNRIENLEWVTQSENIIHAIETGLYPSRIKT